MELDVEMNRSAAPQTVELKFIRHGALSTRAREDLALFRGWTSNNAQVEPIRARLEKWDAILQRDSTEGAVYATWLNVTDRAALDRTSDAASRRSVVEAGILAVKERLRQNQGEDPTL